MKKPNYFGLGGLVVAIAAALWASGFERPTPAPKDQPVAGRLSAEELRDGHAIGIDESPVVLVMFSDFRCKFCAGFVETDVPVLRRKYVESGLLQIFYMHSPVPQLRQYSLLAAEVAECSGEQGHFWPVHEQLFANQLRLDERRIWSVATEAGVRTDGDAGALSCVKSGRALSRIGNNVAIAYRFQVMATPAFLVGVRNSSGTVDVVRRFSGADARPKIETSLRELIASEDRLSSLE
jgi:protein-disulfide isomerase